MYIERMKSIELSNGQIVEILKNLKDAIEFMKDCYIENKEYLDDDSSLYVEYKDGSYYYLSREIEKGKFKRTGIKSVVESNSATYTVYGSWKAIKTDTDDNDEDCCYLIEAV